MNRSTAAMEALGPTETRGVASEGDSHPQRWRILTLLSLAELMAMSTWFAASAIGPQLGVRWSLSASEIGWLTAVVQLGFVLGTALAALLNLADVLPSRWLFAIAAILAAAANASLLWANSYPQALASRLATGFALAGVYPPAMKMISTWFRARRGLAIGTIVGALTVGNAAPFLVRSIPGAGEPQVVLLTTIAALFAGAIVAAWYHDGPYTFPLRPFSWGLVGTVFGERRWRLATAGYLGHMFELYSARTWVPVFVAASLVASGVPAGAHREATAGFIGFLAIAIGGIGCVWGGLVADRRGRAWLVNLSLAASGACAILIGFTFGRSLLLLVPVALASGFFVIADSAQFSALVTESVPPHAVGTALTIQTSLGFLLTMVSIQLVPPVAHAIGWRWAFVMLAAGPVFGIAAINRLVAVSRPTAGR